MTGRDGTRRGEENPQQIPKQQHTSPRRRENKGIKYILNVGFFFLRGKPTHGLLFTVLRFASLRFVFAFAFFFFLRCVAFMFILVCSRYNA